MKNIKHVDLDKLLIKKLFNLIIFPVRRLLLSAILFGDDGVGWNRDFESNFSSAKGLYDKLTSCGST